MCIRLIRQLLVVSLTPGNIKKYRFSILFRNCQNTFFEMLVMTESHRFSHEFVWYWIPGRSRGYLDMMAERNHGSMPFDISIFIDIVSQISFTAVVFSWIATVIKAIFTKFFHRHQSFESHLSKLFTKITLLSYEWVHWQYRENLNANIGDFAMVTWVIVSAPFEASI